MEISEQQFATLARLIHHKLGLSFDHKKIPFLSKRIALRVHKLRLAGAADYIHELEYKDVDGSEMQALANLITTNETYMFREFEQLVCFTDHCLPEVLARKEQQARRKLRIWCAGCSSGEEAYTLAIAIREVFHPERRWDIEIHATDIDENMLDCARKAVYGERSVRGVPESYRHHLIATQAGFRIVPDTSKLVRVEKMNLYDGEKMRRMRQFDFIFCRNVLIYFDDASRRTVLHYFHEALNPGGYIFLGHSESVSRITEAFRAKYIGGLLTYVKD